GLSFATARIGCVGAMLYRGGASGISVIQGKSWVSWARLTNVYRPHMARIIAQIFLSQLGPARENIFVPWRTSPGRKKVRRYAGGSWPRRGTCTNSARLCDRVEIRFHPSVESHYLSSSIPLDPPPAAAD